MTQDTISTKHNNLRWKIIEGTESHFTAESWCGYWRARVKWDGCIDFQHSSGNPIESASPCDIDTFHVCDISNLTHGLLRLAKLITETLPDTDAAENAETAFTCHAKNR